MKRICHCILEGLLKEGSYQKGKFSGSLTFSRIQILSVLLLHYTSWIDFIFKAALLVISTVVSWVIWRPDNFHEKKKDVFIQCSFYGRREEAGHVFQNPPEFFFPFLLTRLAHVLILQLSADKQEEIITTSQWST